MDTTADAILNRLSEDLASHDGARRKLSGFFGGHVTKQITQGDADPERIITLLSVRSEQRDRARDTLNDALGEDFADVVRQKGKELRGQTGREWNATDEITRTEFEDMATKEQHEVVQAGVTIND